MLCFSSYSIAKIGDVSPAAKPHYRRKKCENILRLLILDTDSKINSLDEIDAKTRLFLIWILGHTDIVVKQPLLK